jgi:hypothetical protein
MPDPLQPKENALVSAAPSSIFFFFNGSSSVFFCYFMRQTAKKDLLFEARGVILINAKS